jgi:hypothetical protein
MRRVFWIALGLGAGAAGAIMSMRFLRRQSARVAPATLAREAKGGLMDVARLFSESIAEGKRAMAHKEAELRRDGDDGVAAPGPRTTAP